MKYKTYREVVRSCFLQFSDDKSHDKWPYNQWRHFKRYLDQSASRGRLDIEDDGINLIFSDPQTGLEYVLEKYDIQSFPGFLLAELKKEQDMSTITTSTATISNSTTASSNYNYVTTSTPLTTNTYTTSPSYYTSNGSVVINDKGITINGKKVLTEEDPMTNKDFGLNFDFGPVTDNTLAVSPFGIAAKNPEGGYCYYNSKEKQIVDCTPFTFDTKKFLFKMPVAIAAISVGDVIMHRGFPMFVKGIEDEDGRILVIDIAEAEEKYILPTRNMFGFDFVTKIVSFLDLKNTGASAENPFGNMLPLLLMMKDKDLDPMMLLMMNGGQIGGNLNLQNPLMMYMLMQKDTDLSKILPFLLMGNAFPPMN